MAEYLLCPRKCVGCGEIFDLFGNEFDPNAALCKGCRAEWERAKILPCKDCRMAAIECTCVPDILEGLQVVSVFKFGSVQAADSVIYCLKRKRLPRVYDFVADELVRRMMSFVRERNIDLSNAVITHVPRNKKSIVRYGFDHGELLSQAVAARMGISAISTNRRKGNGKDQKKLTKDKRFLNSSNRFELLKNANVKGKTVIIIDDVITTGATIASCAVSIYDGEPEKIIVLCIAKGNKTGKNKKTN